MLRLKEFSARGLLMDRRPVPSDRKIRLRMCMFFALNSTPHGLPGKYKNTPMLLLGASNK